MHIPAILSLHFALDISDWNKRSIYIYGYTKINLGSNGACYCHGNITFFAAKFEQTIKPYHDLSQLHCNESEHTSLITPPARTTWWIYAHVCPDKMFMRTLLSHTIYMIPTRVKQFSQSRPRTTWLYTILQRTYIIYLGPNFRRFRKPEISIIHSRQLKHHLFCCSYHFQNQE